MDSKILVPVIVVGLVAGGGGFFAGTKYQASKQPTVNGQFGSRQTNGTGTAQTNQRTAGGTQTRQMGGFFNGEVTSKDAQTLTIKLTDGSSKIVVLSGSTSYLETSPSTLDNVAVGDSVTVTGQTNADGSVTANTISLGETMMGQPPQGANQQPTDAPPAPAQ